MSVPTYDKPRIIACAEDHPKHIGLPRGCLDEVRQTLSDLNIKAMVRDERNSGVPLKVTFQGELRPEQTVAARGMLAHDTGVLSATTAFGETLVAAWLICATGSEYTRIGTPAAVTTSMDRAPFHFPRNADGHYWPDRRRPHKGNRLA